MKVSRRAFLGAAGAAAVGAAGGWAIYNRAPRSAPRPENVILIVSDAFRADRLGALRNGKSITPRLDALAAEGVAFTNCYSPSSWTKCSMASILSGAYPPYHGVFTSADTLPQGCDTIASLLKRAGLTTQAIQTNLWLAPELPTLETHGVPVKNYGFRQGFDRYLYLDFIGDDLEIGMPAYSSAEEVNNRLEYILGRTPKPMFLYIHYMETHQPWLGTNVREFTTAYVSDRRKRSDAQVFVDDRLLVAKAFKTPEAMTPAEITRIREIYDEAVSYVDLMIGKAIDTISASVDPAKTLLIFTGDHGDELAEHNGYGHAHTLYEEVERVPLIIRGPALARGLVKTRVSNVNLYETIKSLVYPEDSHREAIGSPLIDSKGRPMSAENDTVFAQLGSINAAEKWRLTKVVRPDGMEAIIKDDTAGKELESQVYSLVDDPGETKKLAADATALAQQAARIERDVKAFASLHKVAYATTEARWQKDFGQPQSDLSDEEKKLSRQLKSLGYLH